MTWKTIGSISLCLIRLEEKQKIIIGTEEDGQGWVPSTSSATMIPISTSGTGKEVRRSDEVRRGNVRISGGILGQESKGLGSILKTHVTTEN